MGTFFKRYLWVIHFLILPAGAYLVADTVNLVIGSRLEASVTPLKETFRPAPQNIPSRSHYREIIEGNIFNATLRGAQQAVPIQADHGPAEPAPAVDLKIRLTGTVVGDAEVSYAIIEHQATREQSLYRLGDSIDEAATIVRIGRDEVILMVGSAERSLRLYLVEEEEGAAPGISRRSAQPSREDSGIAKIASNQWVLDRHELDAALGDLSRLLTKARVVPNFSGGKPDGFRVFSIVPNSLFAKIGLQNGDVLQRINGVEIKDPENFMKVFHQLRGESSISLDLIRNNRKQTFAYEIR